MKPTIYLDASSLKDSSCYRRLLYTIYYGFSRQGDSNKYLNYKAGYGSAFHKALEYWYSSSSPRNIQHATSLATDYFAPFTPYISENIREYRTMNHLAQSVPAYFDFYKHNDLIKPLEIKDFLPESRFAIDWYECDEFKLVLCGTIDLIATYNGEEVFVDHKTTGAYGPPDEYFKDYDLNVQMMFYSWIIQRLIGKRLPCIINGIFLKKPSVKSTVFDGAYFQRSNKISFTDEQMNEFETWVTDKINRIISEVRLTLSSQANEIRKPAPNFSACTGGKFGRCPYYGVCSLTPSLQDSVLMNMERVSYQPLKFGEA